MADYLLKSKILKEGTKLKLYNNSRRVIFNYVYYHNCSLDEFNIANETLIWLSKDNPEAFKEYYRLSNARCKRVLRLKHRIMDMVIGYDCLFLTLTFNDSALKNNSAQSRRDAVRKFLKQFGVPYVANIDFGAKNGREHYHAILRIGEIDYHLWKYGAINGLKIRNDFKFDENGEFTSETVEKLSRYVAKLTNHAIKETTKRSVIMYSRDKTKRGSGL